jgi:hypothetical protein
MMLGRPAFRNARFMVPIRLRFARPHRSAARGEPSSKLGVPVFRQRRAARRSAMPPNSAGASMPKLIASPTVVASAGNKPKIIEEYVGRVNSGTPEVSVARMRSPSGWEEPGQTPQFDEVTLVLRGVVRVESRDGVLDVPAGQAVLTRAGEWVRYSTPGPDGAEYVAVCCPAFSIDTVRRDPDHGE